jgi:TRAP-type C4-dicarboxylate transport system permease small subunit
MHWRLLGALDFVMLSQIVAISFGAGMTLILGRHIEVEFFVTLLPKKLQTVIQIVVLLLSLGLFIVLIWQLILLGHSFQTSGEYSPTAYIRLYPFAYALALASIPVCLVLLLELMKSLRKKRSQ